MSDGEEPDERLDALVHSKSLAKTPRHERYDLLAIGGGTGGLVATTGAAILGARVAVIERERLGGDCLVAGCVPSKALLHAARVAHEARRGARVGVHCEVQVDFAAVMRRMREVRAAIAEHDGRQAMESRGVEVIGGHARFVSPQQLEVGGRRLRFKRALLATGARPFVPDIPGLAQAEPWTNETLFDADALPRRVVVLGGGPVGCELGQALSRLGADVTLLQRGPRLLPRDDPDAAAILEQALRDEDIDVRTSSAAQRVTAEGSDTIVHVEGERIATDRIVVATGRRPVTGDLGLEAAGVEFDEHGVITDARARTTNRRIYAVGDVTLGPRFTHAAWAQAEFATLDALLPVPFDQTRRVIPWATWTDPEVAHVGPPVDALGPDVTTLTEPFDANDRARLDDDPPGFCRVHVKGRRDRIVAATAVGRGAGELIAEIALAMTAGIGLGRIGRTVVPYPSRAELWKALAYRRETARIGPWHRRVVGAWLRLLR